MPKIMSTDPLDDIRASIALARTQEARSGELGEHLAMLAPRLHRAIGLPTDQPEEALLEFVVGYIDQVPENLQALSNLLEEAHLHQQGQVFINIAQDFFLKPPQLVREHSGLQALIDQAYLAHRLLEELNDRLFMLGGAPLIPMDMTMANIVMHDILGEDFANQLDLAVHYAIEALCDPQDLAANRQLKDFLHQQKTVHWEDHLQRWPCLVERSAISVNFPAETASPIATH